MLVLLPLVTAGELFHTDLLVSAIIGMVIFCLLSSVIYIINDISDIESDKHHPEKSKRPLASGAVSLTSAWIEAGVLLAVIIALCIVFFRSNAAVWLLLTAYLILNTAYSVKLKHIAIADVFVLASGYVLRVYFCWAITGIEISKWLFLTLTVGALFLSLGKRRGELRTQNDDGKTRKVLLQYTEGFLDKTMYMCEAISIVFYSLWSIDGTSTVQNKDSMIFTVPFVILIFMRYNLLIERDTDGDPITTLMKDKILLAICAIFAIVFVVLIYFVD